MSALCRVSIVVEMGTRTITEAIPIEETIRCILEEASRTFQSEEYEVLFVGCQISHLEALPSNCRMIDLCSTGYYGWKNAGAEQAKGVYIVFWDSDTRPEPGYLKRAISTLEQNPSWAGLSGASKYMGSTFLSRINTLLSFGFLHVPVDILHPKTPMGHNLVIRKDRFPSHPFGPYEGRVGGDQYIGLYAFERGTPLKHLPELLMYHEDITWSKTFFEQHLREIFRSMNQRPEASKATALFFGAGAICLIPLKRIRKLLLFRKRLGVTFLESIGAIPLIALYAFVDTMLYLSLACAPPLLDRWLDFQLGRPKKQSVS